MRLEKKKELIARTLKVGKNRVILNKERLADIKEAITKQDVKDLLADKAITIKEVSGRRKNVKRKTRRRLGSKKKIVKNSKQLYVKLTRKLRKHVKGLRKKGEISKEHYVTVRKEIRSKAFRSRGHLKERLAQ